MKVLFCSDMFNNVENDVKNSHHPNPISGHIFQENLLRGLIENGINVTVLNSSRIRAYPDYNKIFFPNKRFIVDDLKIGISIPFINLPLINRITQMLSLYFSLKRYLSENQKKRSVILVYNSNYISLLPAIWIKRTYPNVIICDCIGDIHGKYGITTSFSNDVKLQYLKKSVIDYFSCLYKQADCFVLLTKHMRDVLELYDKPYCVLEALYNVLPQNRQRAGCTGLNKKVIFYAGTVRIKYGIEHLLNAFSMVKTHSFQLHIAGNGDGVDLVHEYCRKDRRISYLGVIPPSEVLKHQAEATVLVNPRKSTEPFVKYSFPSKTVECLASGTPYVAHRLPCEPPEYADYIQYPDDESDEALARKLEEICNLPEEKRRRLGERCKQFIETKKNPKVMCKRIVDMWNNNWRDESL